MEEYETFYDQIKDMDGVLRLTIDKKLSEFMGLKKGDNVKVMIKKIESKEEE